MKDELQITHQSKKLNTNYFLLTTYYLLLKLCQF